MFKYFCIGRFGTKQIAVWAEELSVLLDIFSRGLGILRLQFRLLLLANPPKTVRSKHRITRLAKELP